MQGLYQPRVRRYSTFSFMAKDYSKLAKEDLLKVIEKLESHKKYGLIWDEEKTKEKFEKESENAFPVLKEIKGKEIKTDPAKPTNILIEGDNYHALSVLNYTHQGKIDIIYIDPPYNTGKKNEFKYNDSWVDSEDTYRHSKWLSFMSKRLTLARDLLTDEGVLLSSIDDNEVAQLKLLLDNTVFSEKHFKSVVIWQKKVRPSNKNTDGFSSTTEYILMYSKKQDDLKLVPVELNPEYVKKVYKNLDQDPRGLWRSQPLWSESNTNRRKTLVLPDGRKLERKWFVSQKTLEDLFRDNRIIESGTGVLNAKVFLSEINGQDPMNLLPGDIVGTTEEATKELKLILGTEENMFMYPKPVRLIKYLISRIPNNRNATILDFFAGSGTTGHAVLSLNNQDGGFRKFILCTNNEDVLCERVCYPRLSVAIRGNDDIEANGGNLKYFKTSFVKTSISRDDMKMRITSECTEMLCLREGIFEEEKKKNDYHIFEQNGRVMAIYYALEREGLAELKKDLDKMDGDKILYCFTLDPLGLDKEDFADWDNVSLEPIPQKILDIYEQIYEY